MAASMGYWKGGSFHAAPKDKYSLAFSQHITERKTVRISRRRAQLERGRKRAVTQAEAIKAKLERNRQQLNGLSSDSPARGRLNGERLALQQQREKAVKDVGRYDGQLRLMRQRGEI